MVHDYMGKEGLGMIGWNDRPTRWLDLKLQGTSQGKEAKKQNEATPQPKLRTSKTAKRRTKVVKQRTADKERIKELEEKNRLLEEKLAQIENDPCWEADEAQSEQSSGAAAKAIPAAAPADEAMME
jgi:hypothetical protein